MAIVVTVLSLNFVGDALRDALDPQEEELLDTEQ
jgi:ABC-type dipeptide/oligopeptide/nickel transport system permease subunit